MMCSPPALQSSQSARRKATSRCLGTRVQREVQEVATRYRHNCATKSGSRAGAHVSDHRQLVEEEGKAVGAELLSIQAQPERVGAGIGRRGAARNERAVHIRGSDNSPTKIALIVRAHGQVAA
eukprot:6774726-Prymnesium_polylepis.1